MSQIIQDRVKKLLNHAKGTDNPQEAEAFLAKAMALMEEYQISTLDLLEEADKVTQKLCLEAAKTSHAWHRHLWVCLGRYYGCDNVSYRTRTHVKTYLVGRESAIVTTEAMYPFIRKQITAQGRALSKVNGMSVGGATKRVAAALCQRLDKLSVKDTPEPATPAGKNALVTMDAVAAFMKEQHAGLKIKERRDKTDYLARLAAEEISLARQAEGAELRGIA